MAVLLKHLDLGHVAAHIVEYGLSESGTRLGLPRSIANVCKAVYETKRALIKVCSTLTTPRNRLLVMTNETL